MRISKRGAVGTAAAIAALCLSPAMAQADVGDGKLACNTYEICFARNTTNTTYQKQFYQSGSHDGYTFTNISTGATGQGPLRDNAAQLRNRDGSCDVAVKNIRTLAPDQVQTIPNNGNWYMLNSDLLNRNDRHDRVNCG